MRNRFFYTLAMLLALTFFTNARAAEGEKPKHEGGPGGKQAQMLLDHADDLGLTADQKAKLQEMAKGPMSVLTEEQKTKAHEYMPKPGEKKMKKGDGADAPKKPDETKPVEKKPDETK